MKHINDIFDKLDAWRHLPAYQLERRADIFFAIYLPDLLTYKFGVTIEGVIPEFPIRVGTTSPKLDINRSFKVDYLAKAAGTNQVFLVELKTDWHARREKQDWYLEKAREVGMVGLLEGLKKILRPPKSKKKYRHLLGWLQEMGFIAGVDGKTFQVVPADYDVEIVYIQPNNLDGQSHVITFQEVSDVVKNREDELSMRFSKSLLEWAATEAGEA